jgi:hypothetical protein
MLPTTVTLWVAIAGIGGTLGSGILTQRMARRSQREQWGIEMRVQECRELLSQLTAAYLALTDWGMGVEANGRDLRQEYNDKTAELHRVIGSRIVIDRDLRATNIPERIEDVMEQYAKDKDLAALVKDYQTLREEIANIGRRFK